MDLNSADGQTGHLALVILVTLWSQSSRGVGPESEEGAWSEQRLFALVPDSKGYMNNRSEPSRKF